MSEVIFSFNGHSTVIQCNPKDKMREISQRFCTKSGIDINCVYFLYNGDKLKEELTFEESLNNEDTQRNKMNVVVTSNVEIEEPEDNIYLKNINNLKNISSILGPGKWIIQGCQESLENGIKYILSGTVVIISPKDNEIELMSVAKQKYNEFCYVLKEENTKSFSIIKNLIFGSSNSPENNIKWNEFHKLGNFSEIIQKNNDLTKAINDLKNEVTVLKQNQIPKGSIIMWSGTNIPYGYVICDGKNGTPNLLNKFIIGSGGNYKVGDTGGNEKIKLTVNQLPPHNHNFSSKRICKSGSDNSVYVIPGGNDDWNYSGYQTYSTSNTGKGDDIDIKPPFYALAYIMKV